MEIQILDENTIDKIAAGEVVDRPASVVKELVENAMDSGADAVTVEISGGGIDLIRVTDNGGGIAKEQVPRAFLRHATSKIRAAEDLLRLSSLGFRGEALSSICAVAQVEMITRVPEELTGVRYVIWGSVEKEAEEIGAPEGTTVLVRNLFYNVPARKKFLKTPQSEGGHISDLMEHLALSHPDVSFKYVQNGQVKFHTSGNGNLKEIIYRIYGREIANELIWVEQEADGRKLSGFLGSPLTGRASRSFENYYINGRFVKSPVIAKAVEEAYKPYLMQHKYPFFVLHFTLEPDMLDVNVHPSKMEVRFHEQMRVAEFIYTTVRDALSGKEMLKEITFPEASGGKEQGGRNGKSAGKAQAVREHVPEPFETQARRLQSLRQENSGQELFNRTSESVPVGQKPQPAFRRIDYREVAPPSAATVAEEPLFQSKNLSENIIKKDEHILVEKPVQMNFFDEKLLTKQLRDEYRLIGQVFDTYWMIELHDKLLIIDQHAAHEKIKYERLCRQIREADISSQQLNPPIILTLSGREEAVYQEYQTYFAQIGFEIEPFGGNEYAVRSVPADLFGRNAKELLMEIMDELTGGPVRGEPDVILQKLASMSCKTAVKGGHAISREEAEALIDELLALDNPYHCPHGRPTVITMSRYEMEKKFSRIV